MNKLVALFLVVVAIHCTCAARKKKGDDDVAVLRPTQVRFEKSDNDRCILDHDTSPPPKKKKYAKRDMPYGRKKLKVKLIDPSLHGNSVVITMTGSPPDAPVKCNPCEPDNPCGPGVCNLELTTDKKGNDVLSTTCTCPLGYCGSNCEKGKKEMKTDTFCRDKSDCVMIQTAQCLKKRCLCPCNTAFVSARNLLGSKNLPARSLCVNDCPEGQELGENFKRNKNLNILESVIVQLSDVSKYTCLKACLSLKKPVCRSFSYSAKRKCTLFAASKNDHVAIRKDRRIKVDGVLKNVDETVLYTRLCEESDRSAMTNILVPAVKPVEDKQESKSVDTTTTTTTTTTPPTTSTPPPPPPPSSTPPPPPPPTTDNPPTTTT